MDFWNSGKPRAATSGRSCLTDNFGRTAPPGAPWTHFIRFAATGGPERFSGRVVRFPTVQWSPSRGHLASAAEDAAQRRKLRQLERENIYPATHYRGRRPIFITPIPGVSVVAPAQPGEMGRLRYEVRERVMARLQLFRKPDTPGVGVPRV